MILIGSHHTDRNLLKKVKELVEKYEVISEEWNGLNILH